MAVHIRSQIKPLLSGALVVSKFKANQLSNLLKTIKHKISTTLIEYGYVSFKKNMLLSGLLQAANPLAKQTPSKPKFSLVTKEFIFRSKASLKGL